MKCATLGFSDAANLDESAMWPTAFAMKEQAFAVVDRIQERNADYDADEVLTDVTQVVEEVRRPR